MGAKPRQGRVVALREVSPKGEEDYLTLLSSFRRHLKAQNKSEATLDHYVGASRQFLDFLKANRLPTDVGDIRREHIESWMVHLLESRKATTALNRFKGLQAWFRWLSDPDKGDELDRNPMERMSPPQVPDEPPPVLKEGHIAKLLKACEGKSFRDRRDAALISVLIDTGCRNDEVVGIRYHPTNPDKNDLDLDAGVVRVKGKGSRWRTVGIGAKTVEALDRYIRLRARSSHASDPHLWIGQAGPMTRWGIRDVVERRTRKAALPVRVHPHLFRHTWAHQMKMANVSEENIKQLAGWRSDTMLRKYGASAATERALAEHRRVSPRDRF